MIEIRKILIGNFMNDSEDYAQNKDFILFIAS